MNNIKQAIYMDLMVVMNQMQLWLVSILKQEKKCGALFQNGRKQLKLETDNWKGLLVHTVDPYCGLMTTSSVSEKWGTYFGWIFLQKVIEY